MKLKSRTAAVQEWIPGVSKRCPTCRVKVGTEFTPFYRGNPDVPETVRLSGWQCRKCGGYHPIEGA